MAGPTTERRDIVCEAACELLSGQMIAQPRSGHGCRPGPRAQARWGHAGSQAPARQVHRRTLGQRLGPPVSASWRRPGYDAARLLNRRAHSFLKRRRHDREEGVGPLLRSAHAQHSASLADGYAIGGPWTADAGQLLRTAAAICDLACPSSAAVTSTVPWSPTAAQNLMVGQLTPRSTSPPHIEPVTQSSVMALTVPAGEFAPLRTSSKPDT